MFNKLGIEENLWKNRRKLNIVKDFYLAHVTRWKFSCILINSCMKKMEKNRSILSLLLWSLVLGIMTKMYIVNILTWFRSYLNAVKEKAILYSMKMVWLSHESVSLSGMPDTLRPYEMYSLSVASIHGILQARILEWVAIPLFKGSSPTRDWTWVSCTAADSLPSEPSGKPI